MFRLRQGVQIRYLKMKELSFMSYWYAVYTVTGKEDKLRKKILEKLNFISTLFPQRKLQIRRKGKSFNIIKSLLPGYFFIKSERLLKNEEAAVIKETGKENFNIFSKILGSDYKNNKEPIRHISDKEMDHILFLTKNDDVVDFSTYLKEGQKVKIISGPLKGYETIIKKINPRKKRITISLNIFGVNKNIDVGGEMLENMKF